VSLRGTLNEKTKQTTTHVELSEKGLWTGVQIPPAPPNASLKAARFNHIAAFFLGKSRLSAIKVTSNNHLQLMLIGGTNGGITGENGVVWVIILSNPC